MIGPRSAIALMVICLKQRLASLSCGDRILALGHGNFRSVLSARKEVGRIKNKEPSAIALVVEWSKQRLPSVSAWGRILPPRTVKRSVNFFDCPQNSKRLCQYFCNLLVQSPGGMAISWRNDAISWCNIAISWCNSNLLVQ